MDLGPIDYASAAVPAGYQCTTCGVSGCKLWREYQTPPSQTEIVCCDCAGKSQGVDVSDIDEAGCVRHELLGRTDCIGWRVPAIPTAEGAAFWGCVAGANEGARWWRSLPTRNPARAA
jgi:hypothetical protein